MLAPNTASNVLCRAVRGQPSGAIAYLSQFFALHWEYDPSISQTAVRHVGRRPEEILTSRFFRVYFRSLRWAGNFLGHFTINLNKESVLLERLCRYWAIAFLTLHEICHIALDAGGSERSSLETEAAVDSTALEILAVLAQARPIDADPGLALVGTQLGLIAVACSEWSYFVRRPPTHPPALERLSWLNRYARIRGLFPVGSVLWSKDLMLPITRLVALLETPLLPPYRFSFDDAFGIQSWFAPRQVPTVPDRHMGIEDYEQFDAHMNLPMDRQMAILARCRAMPAQYLSAPHAWCANQFGSRVQSILGSSGDGLDFRGAIEYFQPELAGLDYDERTASMVWCLSGLGWDPWAPPGALRVRWIAS
jgi:hypothetical protein